ncbi:hypothetical protein [Streptomyces sp. NPDC046976]|uniref:hypothetical protein n=1 Tax=Streptomyces sp. NPDC046976 TaxID=3155258 RepID=UPI0033FD6D9D
MDSTPISVPPVPPVPPGLSSETTERFRVVVKDNENSSIVVAAGDVIMGGKPPLPAEDIPDAELRVVRRAWVHNDAAGQEVTTAEEVVRLLNGEGPALAVIAGPQGFGKRTAALKALWEAARSPRADLPQGSQEPKLQQIKPDWDDMKVPDVSLLPTEPRHGYLLDITTEISTWQDPANVATSLIRHGELLRTKGSFLVLVTGAHSWPADASGALRRVLVPITHCPSPRKVAAVHLERMYDTPDRARWLTTNTRGDFGLDGAAAHLVNDTMSPADAVRLAGLLAHAEPSLEGIAQAKAAFQKWETLVEEVFTATEDDADDRALLIAALFLSGDDALTVQDASRTLLGDNKPRTMRDILTGPDLTARYHRVKVQVQGRCVDSDEKPGYAQAVLNHLWRQRADIHVPLLEWIGSITQPSQPGAAQLKRISDLLVQLAIAENDIRVVKRVYDWIDNGEDSSERQQLIARVLATAAQADTLGSQVRSLLLDWAQEPSAAVTRVVSLVCQSDFAKHYTYQALIRLRWVLGRPTRDAAVEAAEDAIRDIAARPGLLPRVWKSVVKWPGEGRRLAANRAFLTLLDPRENPYVLKVMMAAAEQDPEVRTSLVTGWRSALNDPTVSMECSDLLISWARAWADGQVSQELMVDILNEVIEQHLLTTPIAALVYGAPGVGYDQSVIDLRMRLRLPSPLSHSPVPQPR